MLRMTSRASIPFALAILLTVPLSAQQAAAPQPPIVAPPQTLVPQEVSPQPAVSVAPATNTDYGTAIDLLNRIQTLLDRAVGDKDHAKREVVGTSGSSGSSGSLKVVIDRAELDEIRAEVAQIRVMLQGKEKP